MGEKCTSRLNMEHGFVRSIRKNQFDRDNYDKEIKQMERTKKPKTNKISSERTKKPDVKLYTPPNRGERVTKATTPVLEKKPVFILTFDEENGTEHDLCIFDDSDLQKESKDFAAKCGLCPPLVPVMLLKLEELYEKYKKKA